MYKRTSAIPCMTFCLQDFYSDKNVRKMNYDESSLFLRLLMLQWEDGVIPFKPDLVAEALDAPIDTVNKCWPAVKKCFVVCENGMINQRLNEDRTAAFAKKELKKKCGQIGGKKRAANRVHVKPEPVVPVAAVEGFGEASFDNEVDVQDIKPYKPTIEHVTKNSHYWAQQYPDAVKDPDLSRFVPTEQEVSAKLQYIANRNRELMDKQQNGESYDED